ncbi:MAG: ice-binding family protein [Chloroflexota bacterium]
MNQHDETVRDDESAAVAGAATRDAAKSKTKRPSASALTGTVFTLIVLLVFLMFSSMARAGSTTPVDLLTAGDFAVLAGSTITNLGCTTITGDVGLDPGTAVTGFGTCPGDADGVALTGTVHVDNAEALQAQADLTTAYGQAFSYPRTTIPSELGPAVPNILGPGVYTSADTTFQITGTLTLNASDPDDEFIFYMGSTGTSLTTAVGSNVVLQGQAQACNVFWVVAGSATLNGGANTATTFVGTIMANIRITLGDNVTVDGRLLAQTDSVTLIHDTITRSDCASGPGPTPGGTPGATPGGTPGATPGNTPPPTSTLPNPGDSGDPTVVLVAVLALAGLIAAAGLVARRRVRSRTGM